MYVFFRVNKYDGIGKGKAAFFSFDEGVDSIVDTAVSTLHPEEILVTFHSGPSLCQQHNRSPEVTCSFSACQTWNTELFFFFLIKSLDHLISIL